MSKQPPPAPTASAIGPCPTIIQIVGRPVTGSLPRTIEPPFTDQTILDDSNASLPSFHQIPSDKLSLFPSLLIKVKIYKKGLSLAQILLKNRLLKELARPLSAPLTDLFKFSLSRGKVPSNKLMLSLVQKE